MEDCAPTAGNGGSFSRRMAGGTICLVVAGSGRGGPHAAVAVATFYFGKKVSGTTRMMTRTAILAKLLSARGMAAISA